MEFALSDQDLTAIILSIRVAVAATVFALPAGFIVSYLMNYREFPGKPVIDGIINLPLVLPPVVVGYLLLLFFGDQFFVGRLLEKMGLQVIFSLSGAVIASAIMGFPLLVRSIRLGMEQIDDKLVLAARTLGAGWFDVILSVIIPLTIRPILVGMTLLFARSLGEFGATSIIAGNIPGVTQTIPLAIFNYTNVPGGEMKALVLCLISIALSMTALMVNEALTRNAVKKSGKYEA